MSRRPLTWNDALDAFALRLRARNRAPRTVAGHRLEVGYLRAFLGADTRPADVTLADLRAYQAALLAGEASRSKKPLAAGTVAKATSVLRTFFAGLAEDELVSEDPAVRLERPFVPERAPRDVLRPREIKRLLAAPDRTTPTGLRDRALVELLYATGLRRGEALALDLPDLDRREREVVVRRGKGGRGRVVPLTRSALEAARAYVERGRPALARATKPTAALWLSVRGNRLNESALRRLLRDLRRRAGLKPALTPHTFRRSFATALLKGGASLRHIQLLLGHAHLNTTAIYLRLDPDELRRELVLRHPRERFEV